MARRGDFAITQIAALWSNLAGVNHARAPAPLPTAPVVLIVDDDPSVRNSLELLMCSEGWDAKAFPSAAEFLANPRPRGAHCLVLDVTLPGLNGLDLQQRIVADGARTPIVFITGYGDVPTSVRAMKAGAVEFLTKPFRDDALLEAVANALECSTAALRRDTAVEALRQRYASLTLREQQVMALVARGRLNKQVGSDLGISEITVKAHRGSMMRKMNARTLPDLVDMAMTLGIRSRLIA